MRRKCNGLYDKTNKEEKGIRKKKESVNRSIYLSKEVHDKVLKIAAENDTSFSNVVVSMIEYCLKEQESEQERET